MAKYLKHYYVDADAPSTYVTTSTEPKYKRHPIEHDGLDVKVWLSDSDGVDVCLSEVPDTTGISTITVGSKNAVMELTETQYNSVKTPLDMAGTLRFESQQLEQDGDADGAAAKITQAEAKETEAQNALNAL